MKISFTIVILLFAFMGGLYLLGASAMLLGLHAPGQVARGRNIEILDGLEGLAFGLVYGITAFGLYRRSSLARLLAMILVIWNIFGSLSDVFSNPGIVNLFWLSAAIFVPVCLFSGTVRMEFATARTEEKVA